MTLSHSSNDQDRSWSNKARTSPSTPKNSFHSFLLLIVLLLGLFVPAASFAGENFNGDLFDVGTSPVLYKGRFRSMEASSSIWLMDLYHAPLLKHEHLKNFHLQSTSPQELLWMIHFKGHEPWDSTPLFYVEDASIKDLLELDTNQERFSYKQLQEAIYENKTSNLNIIKRLVTAHFLQAYYDPNIRSAPSRQELTTLTPGLWVALQNNTLVVISAPSSALWQFLTRGLILHSDTTTFSERLARKEKKVSQSIMALLSQLQQYPQTGRDLFRMIPGKAKTGEWIELQELASPLNITAYSDAHFQTIRAAYLALKEEVEALPSELRWSPHDDSRVHDLSAALSKELNEAYSTLAGLPYKEAAGKSLSYPSHMQLSAEHFYYRTPLTPFALALYSLASLCLFFALFKKSPTLMRSGLICLSLAFALHTLLLVIRCYVLQRPPVSTMYESVLYVPWFGVLVAIALRVLFRNRLLLLAAALTSTILFAILCLTNLNASMDNVQAVLDSQYWLIIHVLMIVGSYAIFLLGGILGHLYLGLLIVKKKESIAMGLISKAILQTMYFGTALIVPGTILGGIWAAESWGRFWDWDPKEAWAFISVSVYLIWIHLFTFNKIGTFGLAIGSIIGTLAISFTWYGVNYTLGTGLHNYGFSNGGELYYYLFLLAEVSFLSLCIIKQRLVALQKTKHSGK